jgi:hypothetical protein
MATVAVLAACGSEPETTQTEDKTVPETTQGSEGETAEPEEPEADPNALGVGDFMGVVNEG